jgi:asparagine synthase (glutamine-hydrolysing)
MCGFSGFYSFRGFRVGTDFLRRSSDAMIPRGPDDAGIWISKDGDVGLSHRRLSTIDLSESGKQPMSRENLDCRIVFNGEIYNYKELRKRLEQKGYRFKSTSDTEVILVLYEEYGSDLVEHLRGMFAFAIWDGRRRSLFLARDHFGMKPLYYVAY